MSCVAHGFVHNVGRNVGYGLRFFDIPGCRAKTLRENNAPKKTVVSGNTSWPNGS